MNLALKLTILSLAGLVLWLVFKGEPFAILSVALAILCLAKSSQLLRENNGKNQP